MNIVDRIPDSIIITNEHDKIELINEKGISLFKLTDYEHKLLVSPIKSFLDKKEFSLSYADISHDVVGDIIYFPKNMGRFRTLYIFQESQKFRTYLHQLNYNFSKEFIFNSQEMEAVYSKIRKVAKTTSTVLITGKAELERKLLQKLFIQAAIELTCLLLLSTVELFLTLLWKVNFWLCKRCFYWSKSKGKNRVL